MVVLAARTARPREIRLASLSEKAQFRRDRCNGHSAHLGQDPIHDSFSYVNTGSPTGSYECQRRLNFDSRIDAMDIRRISGRLHSMSLSAMSIQVLRQALTVIELICLKRPEIRVTA